MKIKLRMANLNDAEEILKIYAPYVRDTIITFEYEVPTILEFRERIKNTLENYPYIVCLIDNKIIGYAYAGKHKERAAYMWNVELSIYLNKEYTKHGIGKVLYKAILDILKMQNIQNVYGVVTSNNISSEKFHEDFGFNKLGIFHKTGYKFNKWHDVTWYEKNIGGYGKPKEFISIKEINRENIEEILSKNIK